MIRTVRFARWKKKKEAKENADGYNDDNLTPF